MTDMHRLTRMERLVGEVAMECLQHASVAVFGVGGVGSHAVEALVRAGVGRLTLVDFDTVCVTNINRQIHATTETVGQVKVEAMAQRCRLINPDAELVVRHTSYNAETSSELLAEPFDYVLDCIDNITAKIHLIQTCYNKKLPIISAMGAANKLDPSLIKISDISLTEKCRLARTMRKELRKRGIAKGVKVVYSTEEFRPLTGPDAHERKPLLGSSSYIPPLFGLTMAGEVIQSLIGEK